MKNIAFKYEEEVRVIYSHLHHQTSHDFNTKLGAGFDVEVVPNDFITKIIVSPKADIPVILETAALLATFTRPNHIG